MLLSFLLREFFPNEHSLNVSAAALQKVTNSTNWSESLVVFLMVLFWHFLKHQITVFIKHLKMPWNICGHFCINVKHYSRSRLPQTYCEHFLNFLFYFVSYKPWLKCVWNQKHNLWELALHILLNCKTHCKK